MVIVNRLGPVTTALAHNIHLITTIEKASRIHVDTTRCDQSTHDDLVGSLAPQITFQSAFHTNTIVGILYKDRFRTISLRKVFLGPRIYCGAFPWIHALPE